MKNWGNPKAFVVLQEGVRVKASHLIAFAASGSQPFKCPAAIEFVGSLPRTSYGKIQKFILREREWPVEEETHPRGSDEDQTPNPKPSSRRNPK